MRTVAQARIFGKAWCVAEEQSMRIFRGVALGAVLAWLAAGCAGLEPTGRSRARASPVTATFPASASASSLAPDIASAGASAPLSADAPDARKPSSSPLQPPDRGFRAEAFFDFDKATLSPEGRAKLGELVSKVSGTKFEVIVVVGHTDGVGGDAYNQKLSVRRAEAVKAYLVSKGIEADRVYTEGKGSKQPVVADKTAVGRARNRRVEIEVADTRSRDDLRADEKPPACAAASLPPFPWPNPPEASNSTPVPRYLLFRSDDKAPTLQDVARRLEQTIAQAGYRRPVFLGAGCDGFAISLDLEHIEDDGTRKPGADGFASPNQGARFDLMIYLEQLFFAPAGHYRLIVLVVSKQGPGRMARAPTVRQLRELARDGPTSLPSSFAAVAYSQRYEVTALVYEFEKGPRDRDVRVLPPEGRLDGSVHLMKAHLF